MTKNAQNAKDALKKAGDAHDKKLKDLQKEYNKLLQSRTTKEDYEKNKRTYKSEVKGLEKERDDLKANIKQRINKAASNSAATRQLTKEVEALKTELAAVPAKESGAQK